MSPGPCFVLKPGVKVYMLSRSFERKVISQNFEKTLEKSHASYIETYDQDKDLQNSQQWHRCTCDPLCRQHGQVVRAPDLKSGGVGLSSVLTTSWICSRFSRVQLLGHACKLIANWSASCQLGFLTMLCSFTIFVSHWP